MSTSISFIVFRSGSFGSKPCLIDELNERRFQIRIWRPRWTSIGPPGFVNYRWPMWWALDRMGLIAPSIFEPNIVGVFMLYSATGEQVFRAGLYPARWQRPFMASRTVEIGTVLVPPKWRRQGIGTLGVRTVLAEIPSDIEQVYFMCRENNVPSAGLAKKSGFEYVARASRKPEKGVLGRYWLNLDRL